MHYFPSELLYHKGILIKTNENQNEECYNCDICLEQYRDQTLICARYQFGRTYLFDFKRVFK